MILKGRLKLIYNSVPPCQIVCDVGTDHAYIPICLILDNICKKVVATDIRQGPLLIARRNIKKYGLPEKIETRVGNGLESIEENEADVIIIAGMGGMLIRDILDRGLKKAAKANRLILQPMNAAEVVREWLYKNGFDICDEGLTNEGEKIYNVICAVWTGVKGKTEDINYYIGQKLIDKKPPLLLKYIDKKIERVRKIIKGLEKSKNRKNEEMEKYRWLYTQLVELRSKVNKKL